MDIQACIDMSSLGAYLLKYITKPLPRSGVLEHLLSLNVENLEILIILVHFPTYNILFSIEIFPLAKLRFRSWREQKFGFHLLTT